MINQKKLVEGIEQYQQPRDPQDINLIAEVRQIMVSAGLLMRVIEAYDSSRFIIEGQDKNPEAQRFLLNRYWSQQLMSSDASSIEVRSYLLNDGDYKDWLIFFREKILPYALEHHLPTNRYE